MKKSGRMLRKTVSMIAVAAMIASGQSMPVLAEEPVSYIYYTENAGEITEHDDSCTSYKAVTDSSVAWDSSGETTWYVASGVVSIDTRVTVSGDVNLILTDGCALTVEKGITVGTGDSLTIYGQKDSTGTLYAGRDAAGSLYCDEGDAGIGGIAGSSGVNNGNGGDSGNITIHGGVIYASSTRGAGIGGGAGLNGTDGASGGDGGVVMIYSGTLNAVSTDGAGIGGGAGGNGGNGGGTITLGWTNAWDSVTATSYSGSVTLAEGKDFWYKNGSDYEAVGYTSDRIVSGDIAGKTLYPKGSYAITDPDPSSDTNGCISVASRAFEDDEVSIEVAPKSGYSVTKITPKWDTQDENNKDRLITVSGYGNAYSFKMPSCDVNIGQYLFVPVVIEEQPQDLTLTEGYTDGNVLKIDVKNDDSVTTSVKWKKLEGTEWKDFRESELECRIPTGKRGGTTEYYCCFVTVTEPNVLLQSRVAKVTVNPAYHPPVHTHSYVSTVTKEPTCTEPGARLCKCTCGSSYTETIPALGHDYVGRVTKSATETRDGSKTFTCSRCNDTYTEVIPKHKLTVDEKTEEIEDLLNGIVGDDEKYKVETKTDEKPDGTTETVVTVGGQVVEKITTDENGEETVEADIWYIVEEGPFTYTGMKIEPKAYAFEGTTMLSEGTDYRVTYSDNLNAGNNAKTIVSLNERYGKTKRKTVTFTIEQADLGKVAYVQDMEIAATGKGQKPRPTVTLKNGIRVDDLLNFTYFDRNGNEVKELKDPGTYTVKLEPKSKKKNLKGSATSTIVLTEDKSLLLSEASVSFSKSEYAYAGKDIIPEYTLTLGGQKLVEGTDFVVDEINNNRYPGKAAATIVFAAKEGNDKGIRGTKSAKFKIAQAALMLPDKPGSTFTYNYDEIVPCEEGGAKPPVIVKNGDVTLIEGTDYKISYSGNTSISQKPGRATITISGRRYYKNTVRLRFTVVQQDIAALADRLEISDIKSNTNNYRKITVYLDGKKFSGCEVTDCTGPDDNGVITATLNGKGDYTGSLPVSYRVVEKDRLIDGHDIKVTKIKKIIEYTGKEIKFTDKELSSLLYDRNSKTYLVPGRDFEVVRYLNNTEPGKATVILRGKGDYGNVLPLEYTIDAPKSRNVVDVGSK